MGSISAGDLVLARQSVDTQRTVERLYLFPMDTLWTGRVNETPTRGERTITFDGGAMAAGFSYSPDLATYGPGLEIWFGSSAGAKDVGVRRLRSITSGDSGVTGTIAVDWHDNIELANDDFITIKNFYPPWPKYSWFTITGPEFRKDGPDGTLYAASGDANDTPAPHVIMGRNYANEMPAAGSIAIQLDATNTQDVAGGGGGATYAWALTPSGGGSFDNAASGTPILTITAEGAYQVHCTVTIDGRSTTAHRAYIVGGGITEFQRGPLTQQWDSTDIRLSLTLTSPAVGASGEIRPVMDWDDVQDHSLAIITAEDWYGSTQKTISFRDDGIYDDHQHIMYCGYLVLENDDLEQRGTGRVELQAVSLVDMFLYSQSLTGVSAASQWYEMADDLMTVAGNLLYLFRWHSTLLDIADWWLPWTDVVRRSANEEFGQGDMLERARVLARARVMGITANPQGEIFVETDLNVRDVTGRAAATTTLILTEADVANAKRARGRRRGDVVRVLADGGYSTGVLGSFQPFFAASQNVALANARPALASVDRLMVPSQAETNRLAARLQAVANRSPYEVDLDFSGNYREVFSPAGQQWTDLGNIFAGSLKANIRGFTDLVDANAVPRQVTNSMNYREGRQEISAIFDVEAPPELEGRTITPTTVPSDDPDDGTWDFPDPPEWPLPDDFTLTGTLLAFDAAEGCWVRFVGASDWVERNGTRTGTDDDDVQGGWDPHWFTAAKQNSTNPNDAILWACQDGKVWRSTDCGQTWQDMTPNIPAVPDSFNQTPAPTVATGTFVQRVDSIHENKVHIFSFEYDDGVVNGAWLLKTDDDGSLGSWTWQALGGVNAGSDGYYYPTSIKASLQANDTANLLGEGDDLYAHFPFDVVDNNAYIDLEYGASIPNSGTVKWGAKFKGNMAEARITPNGSLGSAASVHWWESGVHPNDQTPYEDSDTWAPGVVSTFIRIRFAGFSGFPAPGDNQGWLDYVGFSDISGAVGVRPIWMDLDSEDGSFLWLTLWKSDDTLYLQKRNVSDLSFVEEWSLGACTAAELAAKTFWAAPFTPTFDSDAVFVFGRMNAPQGLANPEHLIKTTNGGGAWSSVENTFGADYISAFRAEGTAAPRTLHAVRHDVSGAAKSTFYSGSGSLAYVSDLSFANGVGVNVDALTVFDGTIALGADASGAIMVIASTDGGATWNDITDSLNGVASEIRSLTYV